MTAAAGDAVIVTGATGTIGLETVLTLAARGFRTWAGVRDLSRGDIVRDAARARGVSVDVVPLDVGDEASVAQAVATVVADGTRLFAVVNNAAVTLRGYFEDLGAEEIRHVFDVNLFGLMNVTRSVLPVMREQRLGRIVNVSSVGGRIGTMGLSAYVATKFALEGFSESLALEVKPLGIDVIIVEPGIMQSGLWDRNRHVAARASREDGPYARWFARAEALADALVRTSRLSASDVARVIANALQTPRPRLRYMVGRRAALVMSLRRHLPGELFERVYFGELLRRVTAGGAPQEPPR